MVEPSDTVIRLPLFCGPRDEAAAPLVLGPENALLEAAIAQLVPPGPAAYHPVVVWGPEGCGKTHLARGLAAAWKGRGRRGLSLGGAEFLKQWTDAAETHAVDDFRRKIRETAFLALDDLDAVVDSDEAQEELCMALDVRGAAGRTTLVTSAGAPSRMPWLSPRLASRLAAGAVVAVAPPGRAVRQAILADWFEASGLPLERSVEAELLSGLRGHTGAILAALAILYNGQPADRRAVRAYLRRAGTSPEESLARIATAAARHFSLQVSDLRSASRRQVVVKARGVAMVLARRLTRASLQQIGTYFGNRDHTTVMHACRKTERLVDDEAVRRALADLEDQFSAVALG